MQCERGARLNLITCLLMKPAAKEAVGLDNASSAFSYRLRLAQIAKHHSNRRYGPCNHIRLRAQVGLNTTEL